MIIKPFTYLALIVIFGLELLLLLVLNVVLAVQLYQVKRILKQKYLKIYLKVTSFGQWFGFTYYIGRTYFRVPAVRLSTYKSKSFDEYFSKTFPYQDIIKTKDRILILKTGNLKRTLKVATRIYYSGIILLFAIIASFIILSFIYVVWLYREL